MTPRSAAELEAEFVRLRGQLEALSTVLGQDVSPDIAPAVVAQRIRLKVGLSAAIQGTKQAINDLLEVLQYASKDETAVVNQRLALVGSPPLHVLLAGRAKTVRRVLKQKQINTETEYYLLKEVLDDVDSALTEAQRQLAFTMIDQYERRESGAV